jgi:hypothetical protein
MLWLQQVEKQKRLSCLMIFSDISIQDPYLVFPGFTQCQVCMSRSQNMFTEFKVSIAFIVTFFTKKIFNRFFIWKHFYI